MQRKRIVKTCFLSDIRTGRQRYLWPSVTISHQLDILGRFCIAGLINVLLYTKVDPLQLQTHARCKFFLFAWKDPHLIWFSNQPIIKVTELSFLSNRGICLHLLRKSTPPLVDVDSKIL